MLVYFPFRPQGFAKVEGTIWPESVLFKATWAFVTVERDSFSVLTYFPPIKCVCVCVGSVFKQK